MESKELTIVIVTLKSENKILKCLESITNEIPVIVVENSNNENFKRLIESNPSLDKSDDILKMLGYK